MPPATSPGSSSRREIPRSTPRPACREPSWRGGTAAFSAGQTISGIAIAGVGINVGSGKFEGAALSQSVSGGGAQTVLATTATASANSQTASAQQSDAQKAGTSDQQAPADDEKKKLKRPMLVKYTGRVTVLLPPKAQ